MTEILDVVSTDLLDYLVNHNSNVIPEQLLGDLAHMKNVRHFLDEDHFKTLQLAVERSDWHRVALPLKQLKDSGVY